MVTLADQETHDALSGAVETKNSSLEDLGGSLALSDFEKEVIQRALTILPDRRMNPNHLPRTAPDLIRMNWW